MIGFNYRKAVQTLNFFALSEGGNINKMKALKLVWFSDRDHLRKYGRPILGDKYYAMDYGPVPSSTKDLTQRNGFLNDKEKTYRDDFIQPDEAGLEFSSKAGLEGKVFSETDIEILSEIYKEFGKYDQFELAKISHDYPEWKRFEELLKKDEGTRFEMNYLEFFKNSENLEKDYFDIDSKDLETTSSIFQENQLICAF